MKMVVTVLTFLICTSAVAKIKTFTKPEIDGVRVSRQSKPKGVCRALGYKNHVRGSESISQNKVYNRRACGYGNCWVNRIIDDIPTIILSKKGKFKDFITGGAYERISCGNKIIK